MALPTNNGPNSNKSQQPPPDRGLPPESESPQETPNQAPVGYPAPRGGLPTPSAPLQKQYAPAPPPPEEAVFEDIPPEEVVDEFYEESAPVPEPTFEVPQTPSQENLLESFNENSATAARERQDSHLEAEEVDFINTKKKRLLPFGGSKSDKTKAKKHGSLANKYDVREDRRNKARIVQIGAITALIGIVGFGGYNALRPPAGVSADKMNNAISAAIATQQFPFEKGEAFAGDFLTTYLNISPEEARGGSSGDLILGYYYTGYLGGEAPSSEAPILSQGYAQTVLIAPRVFKRVPISDSSAAFEVGALVKTYDATGSATAKDEESEDPLATTKWVFYNVNVYYDKKTETMAITPDSPMLIPNASFGAAADIPEEKPLGIGSPDSDLAEPVRTTVEGYFKAFAGSSAINHSDLDQYLINSGKSKASLLGGLDGKFELATDPATSILYEVYPTEVSSVVKVDVKVSWKDKVVGSEASSTTTNRYFLELTKVKDQWLVSNFAPRYYQVVPK